MLQEVLEDQCNLNSTIAEAVKKTLEDCAENSGPPTVDLIQRLLDTQFEKQEMLHKEGIQKILEAQKNIVGVARNNSSDKNDKSGNHNFGKDDNNDGEGVVQTKFLVDGVFCFVPRNFEFPSCNVKQGLLFWF